MIKKYFVCYSYPDSVYGYPLPRPVLKIKDTIVEIDHSQLDKEMFLTGNIIEKIKAVIKKNADLENIPTIVNFKELV